MSRHAHERHAAATEISVLHVGRNREPVVDALDGATRPAALTSVETGDEALTRLRDEGADCVVLERDGNGDAAALIGTIGERHGAPVVVVDAADDDAGAAEALAAGAAEYVVGSRGNASTLLRHRIEGAVGAAPVDDDATNADDGADADADADGADDAPSGGGDGGSERGEANRAVGPLLRYLDGVPDGLYAVDADGTLRWWNEAFADLTGRDADALAGIDAADVVALAAEESGGSTAGGLGVAEGVETTETVLRRPDGDEVPVEVKRRAIRDGGGVTVVGIVRDISTRRDRRRRLDRKESELDRQEAEIDRQEAEIDRQEAEVVSLTRLNAVIRDLDQALMDAETREGIERAVCARLADSDPYTLAWIGERNMATEEIEPKAWAGIRDEAIERESVPIDGENPIREALENREVRVIEGIEETTRLGPWTGVSNEDAQFAVTVPLLYGKVPYGVLVVYTDRPFRFDERELTVLKEHGEAIGHAINRVQQKRALVTDTITEFQFRIRDADNFYVAVSTETDAAFEVEGLVTQSDGSYVEYVTMTGADGEEIRERAAASGNVEHVRLVSEHRSECLFEFRFDDLSIATALADHGASVRSATFEDGTGTVIGALPRSADIRVVAEAFGSSFPGAELVAQRERERSIQTQQKFHETLEDRLTDRQHAALETAYLSGYFEWPRDSTGEEVANSLDITPPTFSKHLRVGQRKLLATLLDEQPRQ